MSKATFIASNVTDLLTAFTQAHNMKLSIITTFYDGNIYIATSIRQDEYLELLPAPSLSSHAIYSSDGKTRIQIQRHKETERRSIYEDLKEELAGKLKEMLSSEEMKAAITKDGELAFKAFEKAEKQTKAELNAAHIQLTSDMPEKLLKHLINKIKAQGEKRREAISCAVDYFDVEADGVLDKRGLSISYDRLTHAIFFKICTDHGQFSCTESDAVDELFCCWVSKELAAEIL